MNKKFISLPLLICCLIVNTCFIVINESGFSAFANAGEPVHFLVPVNAQWRYLAARKIKNDDWKQLTFDDSNWNTGKAGFGYGDNDDRTILDNMRGEFDKLIIRKKFEVNKQTLINDLYLYVRFDDAFIAYINGHEIARSGVLQQGYSGGIDSHEARKYELFKIKNPEKLLYEGENLLAVVGFNRSLDSSDFSLEPILATQKVENPGLPSSLTQSDWDSDLNYLEARLDDQSSYLLLEKFDHKNAIRQLKSSYDDTASGMEFARGLQKLIVQIGDAHAKVNVNLNEIDDQYLPFILADTSIGEVAIKHDQEGYVENRYPLLISIDGLPLQKWLDAAARYVPQSSKQLIRYQSFRQLRSINRIRKELGLPESAFVEFTLQSVDGLQQKTLKFNTSDQRLGSAKVKLGNSRILDDNIGYLRIPSMYDTADEVLSSMESFKDTRGLIIDVRNNRGGSYDILQALYGFFIAPDIEPYVSNIAAYRLSSAFSSDHLHYRPTYRLTYDGWSENQIAAIEKAITVFSPQWDIPKDKFSEWHFMLLGKSNDQNQFHYKQNVVVLSNPASFSATDGFLSAFADLHQVILMGQASSGGSGATQHFRLPNSGIKIALSSMASFRPNGKLYDTNGIEVDIPLMPPPSDFLGVSDSVLEKAIGWIKEN